jgi:hypothetical protein
VLIVLSRVAPRFPQLAQICRKAIPSAQSVPLLQAILFNNYNIQQTFLAGIIPVSFKMLYFFTGFKLLLFQFIGIIPANFLLQI